MPLSAGVRLGPYEIASPLGAGGMGEVYRARDTRLDRTVAIKVLPAHLAASPDRRLRFEREAKAISALSHPHICVLHDIGQHDGVDFLVMECLEGESLADRLKKGALPLELVLRHGIEIAGALDMAHRHGIVHRDLKPGNVMLTKSGAKLLDFGLAKLRAPDGPASAASELSGLATGEKPLTAEGSIVGTFQYMAPEQLEGKEPDARADLFAFGAMLYEMATGQRAFKGKSQASLIAAILASEPPPISSLQPLTPPALDRVVADCLAKEPDERWQSAHDLLRELKWIQEAGAGSAGASVAPRRLRRERAAWGAVAIAAAGLGGLSVSLWRDANREPQPKLKSTLLSPAKESFDSLSGIPALSPDGRLIALVAKGEYGKNRLWVQPLDGQAALALAGTEGATHPFWSADSRNLGFFAEGKLKKIGTAGGSSEILCNASAGRGGAWNHDDVLVFRGQPGEGLSRIAASGGLVTPVTQLAESRHEIAHVWPSFLPDGRHFLYTALADVLPTSADAVFVGTLESNETTRLVGVRSNASYAPPGYLLFAREGALVAQPFDPTRRILTGAAVLIADAVQISFPGAQAAFSASENGLLAYQTGDQLSQLVWFDRAGKQAETGIPALSLDSPRLSNDGRRVIYRVEDHGGRGELWIYDLASRIPIRFTFDPADDSYPVWSPDDTRIVFTSNRGGAGDLYEKAASRAGAEELLLASNVSKAASDWSRDGRFILFDQFGAKTRNDIWSLQLADRKAAVVVRTPFLEGLAQFSPDGRWIAYTSDESGQFGRGDVYVQAFAGTGPRTRVSRAGGLSPRWRSDGKELFFVQDGRTLMAVEVKAGETFAAGEPKPLFSTSLKRTFPGTYDVTPDGQRFLVNVISGDETSAPITLVQNWAAALKR